MANIARIAETYVRRYGIAVVKIEPGTKGPRGKGWNQPGGYFTDSKDAEIFFSENPNWNMGAVLGPSGLCSIDVDNVEYTTIVLDHYGIDIHALAESCPTIVGNPARFRVMFHQPDGVQLERKALTWPNPDDPDGSKHSDLIRRAVAAKNDGNTAEAERLRAEAKLYARVTVAEFRAGMVQDVLPPSMHPGTGRPYEWRTKPNGHFPDLDARLLDLWNDWDNFKLAAEALCPWAPKRSTGASAAAVPARATGSVGRDGVSVIEAFNQAHAIEDELTRYGYERRDGRWLSPHSSTGMPGVWVQSGHNRVWIEHASDPLCSSNSKRPVGPFDLFCYYEHGGDARAAVKAAAELLGIHRAAPAAPALPPPDVDLETGEIIEPAPAAAPVPTPPAEPPGERPLIFNSMPMKTAQLFHDTLPEGGRIIHWRGAFYAWDGTHYVGRDRVYMEQRLYHFMAGCDTRKVNPQTGKHEIVDYNPKAANVNDVAHALRAVCYADLPESQSWIEQRPGDYPAHELIAFRNGFLHYPSRTLTPANDRLFVVNALDFDFMHNPPPPTAWLKFLESLWPDDPESITALAEMFGYLLTDDTSQQKMFMLVGPPRCGKGTILRVLEALVGYHNRVSPSLASIGTQFGLQPLIGKRLAMISDARLSGRADQQPIVENLLRISGEDALTIDRKHNEAWSGKLPTRFVLATNELPAFSDASSALANRFMLFKFNTSFLGREDHGLTMRLLKELPSIVMWALDGLMNLQERGYLIRPSSADDLAADLIEQTSPIRSFVDECCVIGNTYQIDRDDIFAAWRKWCEDQGRDFPGAKNTFGRQLSAAYPEVSRSQPRDGGTRLNLYTGIKLCQEWERKIATW